MSGKIKYYAVFLILIFILILFQWKNPDVTGPYRGIIGNIFNPFVYVINKTSKSLEDFYSNYIHLVNVKKENDLLNKKIMDYSIQIDILNEQLANYERLKELLNFKEAYNFDTITSNVIGRNMSSNSLYLLIDRGSSDGIAVNDAVIGIGGLVGKIDDVYLKSSLVKVLIDITSNVSVLNLNTRSIGIAKGGGDGSVYVDYYDKLDPVNEGDIFVTSGIGGVFPKGLPVGKVEKIGESENGLFQKVILKPTVNFYKIENLMVIKNVKK